MLVVRIGTRRRIGESHRGMSELSNGEAAMQDQFAESAAVERQSLSSGDSRRRYPTPRTVFTSQLAVPNFLRIAVM